MSMTDPDSQSGSHSFDRFTRSMNGILNAVSLVLDNEAEPAEHRVKRAGALLRDYPRGLLEQAPLPAKPSARAVRGGLLAWHIRRIKDYVDAHLGEPIRVLDMAALLGMSSSHFCRAFRASLDVSPHHYLLQRRIDRAQNLMLTTDAPLIRIATDCGLADQAHLSRVFRRLTGETPGAWRRLRNSVL